MVKYLAGLVYRVVGVRRSKVLRIMLGKERGSE